LVPISTSHTKWSIKDTSSLLELVAKEETWENIAKYLDKTPLQCTEWFQYLEIISKNFPKRQRKQIQGQPHRKRRKAAQIERLYKCQEKYCYRSYGTEGALKMHIKLKHPSVTYNENYQQQARNAAIIEQNLEALENEDGEDSEDEELLQTHHQTQQLFLPVAVSSPPALVIVPQPQSLPPQPPQPPQQPPQVSLPPPVSQTPPVSRTPQKKTVLTMPLVNFGDPYYPIKEVSSKKATMSISKLISDSPPGHKNFPDFLFPVEGPIDQFPYHSLNFSNSQSNPMRINFICK